MNQINKLTNVNALKLSHASVQTQKTDESFSTLLKEELDRSEGVRFSKHAAQRVAERGIEVSDRLMSDLNQAVEKAKAKGARDVNCFPSSRQLKNIKFFLPVDYLLAVFYAACE